MSAAPPAERLVALDAFRGLTIAAMILVNNPGSWSHVLPPLRHADWHGWTPTDLVFPFFLFIVGVAIALALGRRAADGGARGPLMRKIVRRGIVLFALGLLLAAWPKVLTDPVATLAILRIPGVLQRIGVCYVAAAMLYLTCRTRTLYGVVALLWIGYQALMTLVPVPGHGAGAIDGSDTHLAAYLDRVLLGEAHLWSQARTWDPEGVLSTLPALGTTLCGVLVGEALRGVGPRAGSAVAERAFERRVLDLFCAGAVCAAAGHLWGFWFPINKPIWTSSYALLTAGLATCGFALCLYACDVRGWRRPAQPFVVYGVNAITVFVGSGLLAKTLAAIPAGDTSLRAVLYRAGFTSWLPPAAASLAWALCWVLAWYALLRQMHRRGIVIRV